MWKGQQSPGVEPRTPSGLSHQCSATEPQQPDNHQPSQSSICTYIVMVGSLFSVFTANLVRKVSGTYQSLVSVTSSDVNTPCNCQMGQMVHLWWYVGEQKVRRTWCYFFNSCGAMICRVSCTDNKFLYVDVSQAQIVSTIIEPGETAVNKSLEHFIAKCEVYVHVYRFTLVVMVGGNKCHWYKIV